MTGMAQEKLIDTPEMLRQCCAELAAHKVVGFDTEFIGEASFVPELCLIQAAVPEALYLIDPFAVGDLGPFWTVLADPARTVVVHAAREEIRLFHRATNRRPGHFFDLQIAAALAGLDYPMGHGTLVRELLNARLHKGETLTDWRKRPLTARQIEYAFDDVRYLLPLWTILIERLDRLGRRDWEREEMEHLIRQSLGEEPSVERWRKLRGLGSMDRKKLAVVQAVFEWRERVAADRNRPVRTVLRDDLIVEVARRTPKSVHDIEVMRGIPKRDVPELFRIAIQARSLPPEQWPAPAARDEDEPNILLVAAMLNVVLADICASMQLSPKLVATTSDIRQLVRCEAERSALPADSPFATGWRAAAILPELKKVLRGQRILRIASLTRPNPFEYRDEV